MRRAPFRKRRPDAALGVALLIGFAACAGPPSSRTAVGSDFDTDFAPARDRQTVRVALAFAQREVRFEATAPVVVRAAGGRIEEPAGLYRATVEGERVVVFTPGGRALRADRSLRMTSPADVPWSVGGDRFTGTLVARRNDDGTVSLINDLPIETYLRGVVPWEIGRPSEDALAAVEAQAIAARTYTYARLGRWDTLGFDVYADVRDQVYRGLTGTAEICDRAIETTRHRVAVRDGVLIRAYYSSTGGGHTSTLVDVWTRDGAPYLVGRRDADQRGRSWCADSPHFRWTEVWSARELGDIVRETLPEELGLALEAEDVGVLVDLEVLERDRSGRVKRLAIVTDVDRFELWGDRIRWVLRPVDSRYGILRSTMFRVENVRRDGRLVGVVLRGGGFGHGVGLCQTGAIARARAGQDVDTILRAYYAGVEVADVRSLRGWELAR